MKYALLAYNRLKQYDAVIVLVAALLFYFITAGEPLAEGDSADYTTLVTLGSVSKLPSHIGYLTMGWFAIRLFSIFPAETVMQLLSIIFGALGVMAVYKIVFHYVGDRRASWLAALALLTAGEYWYVSTIVEVYAVQTGLLLSAYALWVQDDSGFPAVGHSSQETLHTFLRLISVIVLFLIAITVSPASIAFFPMFLFGRKLRLPRQLILGGGLVLMAGTILGGILLYPIVIHGRSIQLSASSMLRNWSLLGISVGLISLVSLMLIFIDYLRIPGNGNTSRRLMFLIVGIFVTSIAHIPFAAFINVGPIIPLCGLAAIAFGISIGWVWARESLSFGAIMRVWVTTLTFLGLSVLGFIIICNMKPKLSQEIYERVSNWVIGYQPTLMYLGIALALVGLVTTNLALIARSKGRYLRFDSNLIWPGVFIALASTLISLSLIIFPRNGSTHLLYEAFDVLDTIDPPAQTIVGDYSPLMLYSYNRLGYSEWPTEHLMIEYLTPHEFAEAINENGKLYLLGFYALRDLQARGIAIEQYELEPLDGSHGMLSVLSLPW